MLSSRLAARCSSAKMIGTASAQQHALKFSKKSIDGSGKATLVEQLGAIQTPGVLFEIDVNQREELDKFEGAGKGYDRDDEFRVISDSNELSVTTYLASENQGGLSPFDWYLALVIAGALEHNLGDGHLAHLRATKCMVDENTVRKSRVAALKALAKHGYDDHKMVLID